MVSVKDANAMAEVIYYLKGIKQEDINKIQTKDLCKQAKLANINFKANS